MSHLNPVTGSPIRVGPHGGDYAPRAFGSSLMDDNEYFDVGEFSSECDRYNAEAAEAQSAKRDEEGEVLEWWERAAKRSPPPAAASATDAEAPPAGRGGRRRSAAPEGAFCCEIRVPTPRAGSAASAPSARNPVGPEGRSESQRTALRREHEALVLRDRDARARRLQQEREDERREDEKRREERDCLPAPRGAGSRAAAVSVTGLGRRRPEGAPRPLGDALGRAPLPDAADALSMRGPRARRPSDDPAAHPARADSALRAPSTTTPPPASPPDRGAATPEARVAPRRRPPSAELRPGPKAESVARHLQAALAAALAENDVLADENGRLADEVGRYRSHFGPLPWRRFFFLLRLGCERAEPLLTRRPR